MLFRSKPEPKLLKAFQKEEILTEEHTFELSKKDSLSLQGKVRSSVQPASVASIFAKVNQKPKIQTFIEKAQTSEPDVKKELKRGSMKEQWGLSLAYKVDGAKISLLGECFWETIIKHYNN